MAKIFAPPVEVGTPPKFEDFYGADRRYEPEQYYEACEAWNEKLAEWCRSHGKGPYAGKIASWYVADGSADYMILSLRPLQLIHLPHGDGYAINAIMERGLNAADVKANVDRRENLPKLAPLR